MTYLDPEVFPETEAGDDWRFVAADAKPIGDPVPAGTYVVQIAEMEVGRTKEAELPKWKVEFEIIAGEQKGRRVFKHYVLSEKARPFFDQLVLATGKVGEESLSGQEVRRRLVGAEVALRVDIEKSDAYGDSNNVRHAYSLDSARGRQAAQAAGYDSRLP
jgi:Protein of unknown function (DUF669)